jgi:adenine phosphoribosyltransferase (EC 2.4.2.7)
MDMAVIPVVSGLKEAIRNIPDFPKPGILFRDITPVLQDPDLFRRVIDASPKFTRGAA